MSANLVLQLNLSTTATLRTRESGHYKEMAIVERFKQEFMYGLIVSWDKSSGCCREVAIAKRWSLEEVQLYNCKILIIPVSTNWLYPMKVSHLFGMQSLYK